MIQFNNCNEFLFFFIPIIFIILDITFCCINKIERFIAISKMSKKTNRISYKIETKADIIRLIKRSGKRASNSNYVFKLFKETKKEDELFFYIAGNANVVIKKPDGEKILNKSIDISENINNFGNWFCKTSVFISDKRIVFSNRHMLLKKSPKNKTFEFPLHSIIKTYICEYKNISSFNSHLPIPDIEFELGIEFSTDEYDIQFSIIEDVRLFSSFIPNDFITIRNWIYEIFVHLIKTNKRTHSISTPLKYEENK
ncbi:MAG: hypothetical protein BGN88_02490 [Clostridiales bacterium 43-6]|nr:MAG: hypothetical protein BGN88_02490 [Clostridiales bacterium 43-6]